MTKVNTRGLDPNGYPNIWLLAITGFNGPKKGTRPTWLEYWAWFDSPARTQSWDDCSLRLTDTDEELRLDLK
jgi:hypothetical protein